MADFQGRASVVGTPVYAWIFRMQV